jgi:DNA topoisomerase IA
MQKMQQCMQMCAQLEQTVSQALAFNVTQTMQQAQQLYASYRH